MSEVVRNFGTSKDRRAILAGLLEYRQELYSLSVLSGFQWLDGSFMENIEVLDNRSPNDVDVVTFFSLPAGVTQADLFSQAHHLFHVKTSKARFRVDGYPMILSQAMEEYNVHMVAYWYSMWSHTRKSRWKGFVRVNLDQTDDIVAHDLLKSMADKEVEQ